MNVVKTNTLNLAILLMVFTLELSFIKSIPLNLFVVVLSIIYLIYKKSYIGLIGVFIIPIIPALSTYWSVAVHGASLHDAWVLFSRTFAFASLGMMFAFGIDIEELLLMMEQKGFSKSFVYGILVVVHSIPAIKNEVTGLRNASLLRGKRLTVFSPFLYLKTIFIAYNWRDDYTEAMISRGFDDQGQRVLSLSFVTPITYIALSIGILLIGNSLLFITL